MTTILSDHGVIEVSVSNGLWLDARDAERATGWTLKPEGMCRGEVCVPLPSSERRDATVDVAAFWRRMGAPLVHDDSREAWVLGASAGERNEALMGANAPDFSLPDWQGTPRTLSSLRGKKVFLTTWASW